MIDVAPFVFAFRLAFSIGMFILSGFLMVRGVRRIRKSIIGFRDIWKNDWDESQ